MSETTTAPLIKIAANPALTEHLHDVIGMYCHQVRNHFNSLKLCLYLAKRGGPTEEPSPWTALNARYQEMERWLERLQLLCRPLQLNFYQLPFDLMIADRQARWTEIARENGGTLVITPPESQRALSFDLGRLGEALDEFADWRFRNASRGTRFLLDWEFEEEGFLFRWSESCDGLKESPETHERGQGSSLCRESLLLPLLNRVVSLHGGSVIHSLDRGCSLSLRLPSKQPDAVETIQSEPT